MAKKKQDTTTTVRVTSEALDRITRLKALLTLKQKQALSAGDAVDHAVSLLLKQLEK